MKKTLPQRLRAVIQNTKNALNLGKENDDGRLIF